MGHEMRRLLPRCDSFTLQILRGRKQAAPGMGILASIRGHWHSLASGMTDSHTVLTLLLTLSFFFSAWCAAGVVTKCDNCLVVVLSGSMEPFYHRTDLLLLQKITPVSASDVIVFSLPDRQVPIVHRVHRVYEIGGTRRFLTKGDNNEYDDRTLYPDGYHWVREEDVVGKVALLIPHAGFLTILSEDNPLVKFLLMGLVLTFGWFSGF